MKDRIRDRIITGITDHLTDAGLFVVGLFEKAGSVCCTFVKTVRDYCIRFFGSRYIRSLMACLGCAVLLFLLLAARLRTLGVIPTADIVRMVRVADSAWSIVTEQGGDISDDVKAYSDTVDKYAKQYGMVDYIPLIYAVMEQESGGGSLDIMQSSTCFYNEEYSQTVDGITDQNYSIQCGVQYLKYCLNMAGVTNPSDIRHMKLALQGYNYGHNYIGWALKRDGGYTKENAEAFADLMKKSLGWTSYGDTNYPAHVLRYYPAEYQQGESDSSITETESSAQTSVSETAASAGADLSAADVDAETALQN